MTESTIAKTLMHPTCILEKEDVSGKWQFDFDNIAENGFDLRPALKAQDWEGYFNRLSVPVYYKLVKEFWKHAYCDDLQVVSYVLGKRIIITERSIAMLPGPETIQGYRFQTNEPKTRETKDAINKVLYSTWTPGKADCKTKDLHPDLRIWHKIILKCFNPRPMGSSPYYINFTQKVMLYFIKNEKKICLPYFLFSYLKDCIRRSRTTAAATKSTIKYIPFGRLLFDIFIESKLIKALTTAGCTEDLSTISRDAFSPSTMKKMGLITGKVKAESDKIKERRVPLQDYPLWSKADDPEAIKYYLDDLKRQGFEIDVDEFFRVLPEAQDFESPKKKKSKTKKEDTTETKDDSEDAITSRVTRSSARNSSKFVVLTNDDEFDVVDAVSNPTPTLALPSPEQTSVVQPTSHTSPPRPSFFQPTIEEEPLWQMLQNPKPSEPTSPILLPYTPQASEPQTSEKPASEPKSSEHSEGENLSPTPSVSFPMNTTTSSPSNNSESNRKFV
ncbi:uncharacterized protein LOC130733416 [Lotus japonicus]|uniref:uncharacterized protein LOC130733416 n=1 Tax=Lotus japonicus TaxID=34305 RepID=UPI002589E3F2|nr:uncharacterized protein LOC130733416 [Lotus japonicus]